MQQCCIYRFRSSNGLFYGIIIVCEVFILRIHKEEIVSDLTGSVKNLDLDFCIYRATLVEYFISSKTIELSISLMFLMAATSLTKKSL